MTAIGGAAAIAAVLPPLGTDEGADMHATYDATVDALAVTLLDTPRARTTELARGTLAHFDAQGRLIEIEILRASEHYPREALEGLASPAVMLTLPQAAKESGLSAVTLRIQLQKGRLVGVKHGRDWLISRAALLTYLDHRDPRGRPARRRKGRRPAKARAPA